MQSPNSFTRFVSKRQTVTVGSLALDLYRAPHGNGWWTPADPVFDTAGFDALERTTFLYQQGLTNIPNGFEIVWDHTRPDHRQPVALLSRNAVAGVLANAVTPVDPATVVAIDAALAG